MKSRLTRALATTLQVCSADTSASCESKPCLPKNCTLDCGALFTVFYNDCRNTINSVFDVHGADTKQDNIAASWSRLWDQRAMIAPRLCMLAVRGPRNVSVIMKCTIIIYNTAAVVAE